VNTAANGDVSGMVERSEMDRQRYFGMSHEEGRRASSNRDRPLIVLAGQVLFLAVLGFALWGEQKLCRFVGHSAALAGQQEGSGEPPRAHHAVVGGR